MNDIIENKSYILEIDINSDNLSSNSDILSEIESAKMDLVSIQETIDSVKALKIDCDKTDYALAACSGVLCGLIDVFLVGKPGESPLGNITDTWVSNRTCDFAKLFGWEGEDSKSAIRFLEKNFGVPYDQRGAGDAGSEIFQLHTSNHHFKSLAHNPSLLGLFYSILDQFTNQSHFVSNGELISLNDADENFNLRGNNVVSKLFCAFLNWIGHIMSDISGASGSIGRGTGIPSPLWTWMNDVVAIKAQLGISPSEFNKSFNELALSLFKQGYDARFQTAQAIPVIINELLVRMIFCIRRMFRYYANTPSEERTWAGMWSASKPFSNASVDRMLTIAHGTFCLIDIGDATARSFISGGGNFNPVEFFLRINIVGVGRFSIALYNEVKNCIRYRKAKKKADFAERRKIIVEDYIAGLKYLHGYYDDYSLLISLHQLINSNSYQDAFDKTVELAEHRGVTTTLKSKADIDNYFLNL